MKLKIIFLIVNSLFCFTDAHGGCYWCWRWRSQCQTESTLTIVSSECSRPLTGVRIYSRSYMTIVSSSNGRYKIRACRLPLYVTIQKYGFRAMRVTVRRSTETFIMRCLGSGCGAKTVYATVRSDCAGPLEGVKFTSTELMGVSSNYPGSYRLTVCTVPTDITCEKEGHEPVTQRVTRSSMLIQMTCTAPSCDAIQKTISIVSSVCSIPVSDVTITSKDLVSVRNLAAGSYELSVCSLPVIVRLEKSGFSPITVKLTTRSREIPLPCLGTTCTKTVTITVTSDCAPAVMGVTMTSEAYIDVSSSAPGTYEITACSFPVTVQFSRTGYSPVTFPIWKSTYLVSLTCEVSPLIIEDPQSKYRHAGDDVMLCCQAAPASPSLTYKWFKDGSELPGEITNTLSLNSLTSSDEGRYKCLATTSDTLPAAVSAEAQVQFIAGTGQAYVDHIVTVLPGCHVNVGRCEAWPCRTDSAVTCSDDKVVCEVFETAPIDCSGIVIQVDRVTGCSCSCGATPIIINGLVFGSDTNAALEGINVERNGQTTMYITDDNGEFTFSVPSTVRRLILKATDPNNNYIKAFHIVDILPNYQDPVSVVITMVKRAPFIQINPTQENELSISGSPSEQDTGVASMTIPANAFFTPGGIPYTGEVSVSLTYLDPHDPDMLALAPGRFVTIDSNGEEFVLITQGVFSLSAVDNTGNELIINGEIGVSGKPGFTLWALDQVTATWKQDEVNPGRKRRQLTQQQYLGSFNPQNVDWWNIDKVLTEPDCFFRVRVFQDSIAPSNEVVSGLLFQPYVTQFLASGTDLVTYRSVLRSSPCVNIKCPAAEAQLTIRIRGIETVYGLAGIEVSILPANITEYSTGIKSVLEATPYFYSLLENTTDTMFVNTHLSMSGPFYQTEQTCLDATINDPAFWFTKRQAFVEGDFDDSFEGRCVAKLKIQVSNSLNASIVAAENLTAVSSWGDNMFSIRTGELNYFGMGGPWTIYDSCIEYRCSRSNGTHNDTTRVDLGTFQSSFCFSNFQHLQKRMGIPGATFFNGPILDPAALPSGFYYSNTTNVQPAMSDCLSGADYIGALSCLNSTTNG